MLNHLPHAIVSTLLVPTTESVEPLARSRSRFFSGFLNRYRLSHCIALLALGLLLMAAAAAQSRAGSWTSGLLFWMAVVLFFAAPAPFLVRQKAQPNTQEIAAILLGLTFELARLVAFPIRFVQTDELDHITTLNTIERTHHLFHANTLLPVSPWYPGLETVTQGIQDITGLSQFYAGYAVLCVAHVLLVVGIFELVARVTGSRQAAGVAVLVYASSLQWYFFNAQFAYQSLALPLMIVGLAILARASNMEWGWTKAALQGFATVILVSMVFVHHVTAWIACAVLLLWCLFDVSLRHRKGSWSLVVVTTIVTGATLLWTAYVGHVLTSYLEPVLRGDVSGVWDFISGSAPARKLFTTTSGASTAKWEEVIDVVSLGLVVLLIPFAAWDARRWIREKNGLGLLLALLGSSFPLLLVTRFVPSAGESGDRASTFVYVGLALLFGAWMSRVMRRRPEFRAAVLAGLLLMFLGGIAGGNGPDVERLPGPFLITADARSADSIALAPAYWLGTTFRPESVRLAADFDDRNLMAAFGNQVPITNSANGIQVAPLFTSKSITPVDRQILKDGRIDLVVVDIRMSEYLPVNGVYFEVGEPGANEYTRPLAKSPLEKFDHVNGVSRIYDDGDVSIYDVRSLDRS